MSSIYGPRVVVVSTDTTELYLTVQNAAERCTSLPCNPTAADTSPAGDYVLRIERAGLGLDAAEFFSQSVVGDRIKFAFGTLLSQLNIGRYFAMLQHNGNTIDRFEIELSRVGPMIVHFQTKV